MSDIPEKFVRIAKKLIPTGVLMRVWPLTGGVSAEVYGLEIEHGDGHLVKYIFRRHGDIDLAQNPQVARHEYQLLQFLKAAGLSVATPYLLDTSGEIFPTPYLITEYLEGQTEFAPPDVESTLRQMAHLLACIHRVENAQDTLAFLPRQNRLVGKAPSVLDETLNEGSIRQVLETHAAKFTPNPPTLIHRDFWPGNLLWQDGQLVGIIDWEDAAFGDPLEDLACTRLEVLWAFGQEAMHTFTAYYQTSQVAKSLDFTALPWWDLWAGLRKLHPQISSWGLGKETEEKFYAQHRWFTAQAITRLTG
jgi:aminoglycoside phosphotransferase (APT) family kinase protein